ncbi:MAG: hypothetical protein ACOQNV_03230 [Mycoplasmoidaceae bacterium]
MQKWESYRHEINQSSQIGYGIMVQTQQIEKYKRAIDRVNPAILQNVVDPELTLHKGVSEVIVSQKQIPNQITRMFKDLSKAKSINNKNNISTILFNLQNESILDQKLKIKDSWLNSNKDYAALSAYIQEASLNKDKEFEKDLQTKFESLAKKKQQTKIGVINKLSKDEQKNVGHHVFVISIAIACVFFLLTFVLLLVRWFM